ncbi:MAG: LytR C-terminal domain-containing protein [Actinomycetota bacterium]
MSRPAALLSSRHRTITLFTLVELVLVLAVPFLAIAGYHALLESRDGRFVDEPTAADPGWRALVDPSPVTAVVETDRGRLTGITLLAAHVEPGTAGTAVLVPGTLQIDGVGLDEREPLDAIVALQSELRLRISALEIMDGTRWAAALGGRTYTLDNPDPVIGDDGDALFEVGSVALPGEGAAPFLGRPSPGTDPITLSFRRELFWSALLADPPTAADAAGAVDPLVAALAEVAGTEAGVVELPLVALQPDPEADLVAAEELVRAVVPVPAGANPGDRLQVRVIDRTGAADLTAIAAEVASTGSEVVEIGNASTFDDGLTQILVPPAVADAPGINELASLSGATTVLDDDLDTDGVVTLVIGSDFVADQ